MSNIMYPKILNFFCLFILMISFISCDPDYEIEWKVKNNTQSNISIFSKTWQDSLERYNSLSPSATVLLLNEPNFGVVSSHLEYTERAPFEYLVIINSNNDTLHRNVYLTENWNAKNLDNEVAEYTLEIYEDDF